MIIDLYFISCLLFKAPNVNLKLFDGMMGSALTALHRFLARSCDPRRIWNEGEARITNFCYQGWPPFDHRRKPTTMSISLLTVNLLIKLFLFLWIIHDVFRLVPLHFCEGKLINCGNAYVSIYQHVFITWSFVFVSLKNKDYRFLIGGLGIMSILKKRERFHGLAYGQ